MAHRGHGGAVTIDAWLAARTPAPPPALRGRIAEALRAEGVTGANGLEPDVTPACLRAAERMLDQLLRTDSSTRESALDLLTADALMTYAFESAAGAPADLPARAAEAMRRIAALGASTRASQGPT